MIQIFKKETFKLLSLSAIAGIFCAPLAHGTEGEEEDFLTQGLPLEIEERILEEFSPESLKTMREVSSGAKDMVEGYLESNFALLIQELDPTYEIVNVGRHWKIQEQLPRGEYFYQTFREELVNQGYLTFENPYLLPRRNIPVLSYLRSSLSRIEVAETLFAGWFQRILSEDQKRAFFDYDIEEYVSPVGATQVRVKKSFEKMIFRDVCSHAFDRGYHFSQGFGNFCCWKRKGIHGLIKAPMKWGRRLKLPLSDDHFAYLLDCKSRGNYIPLHQISKEEMDFENSNILIVQDFLRDSVLNKTLGTIFSLNPNHKLLLDCQNGHRWRLAVQDDSPFKDLYLPKEVKKMALFLPTMVGGIPIGKDWFLPPHIKEFYPTGCEEVSLLGFRFFNSEDTELEFFSTLGLENISSIGNIFLASVPLKGFDASGLRNGLTYGGRGDPLRDSLFQTNTDLETIIVRDARQKKYLSQFMDSETLERVTWVYKSSQNGGVHV